MTYLSFCFVTKAIMKRKGFLTKKVGYICENILFYAVFVFLFPARSPSY